jgi:hypothetical protein
LGFDEDIPMELVRNDKAFKTIQRLFFRSISQNRNAEAV